MEHAVGFFILAALLAVIFGAGLARLPRRVRITLRLGCRRYRRAKLRRSMPALLLATLAITALAVLVAAFLDDDGSLGPTGDFFGGLMNPLIAAAALLALLKTIRIQQTELRMTREELARSSKALRGQEKLYERQLFNQVFAEALADFDAARHDFKQRTGESGEAVFGQAAFRLVQREITSELYHPTVDTISDKSLVEIIDRAVTLVVPQIVDPERFTKTLIHVCEKAAQSPFTPSESYKRIALRLSDNEIFTIFFIAFTHDGSSLLNYIEKLDIPNLLPGYPRMPKRFGDPTELLRLAHSRSASNPSVNGSNS
jgi:hypothetical protein